MSRIRTLKPEILEDDRTASLSDAAFRLFVAMILLADDHGNLRGNESWLGGQIWWNRPKCPSVAEVRGELAANDLIEVYDVSGQTYCHIRTWKKHQRIDNAGKARVPGPSQCSPRNSANLGESPQNAALPPTSDLRPSDLEQTLAAGADSLPPKLLTSGDPEPKQPRQRERRQPKTRLQADWVPTEQHRTRALELGLSVAAQATKFRDYHEAKGSVFANWDAAFRNWLSNAREFADARGEPMPKKPKLVVVDSDEEPPIPTSQWGGT